MPSTHTTSAAGEGKPAISQYLRLSTVHVPEPLINGPGGLNAIDGVIAYAYDEGAWLWVPDDVDEHVADYEDSHGLSEIVPLWRRAREHGCDFIRLDADEDVDASLPVYEWG